MTSSSQQQPEERQLSSSAHCPFSAASKRYFWPPSLHCPGVNTPLFNFLLPPGWGAMPSITNVEKLLLELDINVRIQ